MRNNCPDLSFIKKSLPKDRVYSMWLSQLEAMEHSTICPNATDGYRAAKNSIDIGFKLFSIIDSISLNLLGSPFFRNRRPEKRKIF